MHSYSRIIETIANHEFIPIDASRKRENYCFVLSLKFKLFIVVYVKLFRLFLVLIQNVSPPKICDNEILKIQMENRSLILFSGRQCVATLRQFR